MESMLAALKLVLFYDLKTPGVRNIKLKMTREREAEREGGRKNGSCKKFEDESFGWEWNDCLPLKFLPFCSTFYNIKWSSENWIHRLFLWDTDGTFQTSTILRFPLTHYESTFRFQSSSIDLHHRYYIYIYRSLINIVVMKESFKDSLNIFLVAVPSTNILQFYKICGVRINPWLILIRVKQTYIRTIFKLSCHENEKSRKNIFFHILGLLFQVESDVFQADFDYKDALYVSVVDNVAYAWMSEKHEERTVVSAWDCTWRVKISARGNLWAEAECKPLRHRHSFVWISFDGDTRKDEQPSMATPGVFMNFNAV